MSLLSENVIPGNHGKVFSTNAAEKKDLDRIKKRLLELDGIKDVKVNFNIYPIEITVHTSKLVSVENIENKVKITGYHAIPKGIFPL